MFPKLFFAILIVVVLSQNGKAQISSDDFSSKTLAVLLEEENPDYRKKLSRNPTWMKEYKESVSDYNEYIKYAIEKYWTHSKNIEYISHEQLATIEQNEDTKYLLLIPCSEGGREYEFTYDREPSLEFLGLKESRKKGAYYVFPFPFSCKLAKKISIGEVICTVQNLNNLVALSLESGKPIKPKDYA